MIVYFFIALRHDKIQSQQLWCYHPLTTWTLIQNVPLMITCVEVIKLSLLSIFLPLNEIRSISSVNSQMRIFSYTYD